MVDGGWTRLHPHKPALQCDDVAAAAPLRLKVEPGQLSGWGWAGPAGQQEFYIPIENNHLQHLPHLPRHFPHLVLTCFFQSIDLMVSNTIEICGDV